MRTQLWTQRQSLNNSPSNSTKHIPSWKAASSSANQEIWQVLQILNFQYRMHKSRYINAVHTTPSYSFKIHFRIILPGTPMPSKCYLSPIKPYTNFSCPPHVPHVPPPHPPWPDHPEQHKSWWSSSPSQPPDIPSLLRSSTVLSTPSAYVLPLKWQIKCHSDINKVQLNIVHNVTFEIHMLSSQHSPNKKHSVNFRKLSKLPRSSHFTYVQNWSTTTCLHCSVCSYVEWNV